MTGHTKHLQVSTKILKDIFRTVPSFIHLLKSVICIQDSMPRVQSLMLLDMIPKISLDLLRLWSVLYIISHTSGRLAKIREAALGFRVHLAQ